MGITKRVKPISARQMGKLAQRLELNKVDGDLFQKWLQGEKLNQLVAFLKGVSYDPSLAQSVAAQHIMVGDLLTPDEVIEILAKEGIKISLTEEEKDKAKQIPFSKSLLRKVARREWRGKRAILWWAPPGRFGINMLKLRNAFSEDPHIQKLPYESIDGSYWWLEEKFAREVLPGGWHLTLVKIPDETRNKTYDQQKELMTKDERLIKPVELMFLIFVNYKINAGERLFGNDYSRTDAFDSVGAVVGLGGFGSGCLIISSWHLSEGYSDVGLVFSRKFD